MAVPNYMTPQLGSGGGVVLWDPGPSFGFSDGLSGTCVRLYTHKHTINVHIHKCIHIYNIEIFKSNTLTR